MLYRYIVFASVTFEVPQELYAGALSFPEDKLIEMMTKESIAYENKHQMGYYPALQYLFDNAAISIELADAYRTVCNCVVQVVHTVIDRQMKSAFSQTKLLNLHHRSYNIPPVLPKIAPKQRDDELKKHYAPNAFIAELELTQLHKKPVGQAYEKFVRYLIHRWLKEYFNGIKIVIVSSKVI
ncbi:MAG: hypothetical protein ACNYNY_06790 [Candidatus Oxydemutatoraceae bacterium WSBS_2016_MAG_OTU14]